MTKYKVTTTKVKLNDLNIADWVIDDPRENSRQGVLGRVIKVGRTILHDHKYVKIRFYSYCSTEFDDELWTYTADELNETITRVNKQKVGVKKGD